MDDSLYLLQEQDAARRRRRLQLYIETRGRLRAALAQLLAGQKVVLFGSLTHPGVFNDHSDIDIAIEQEFPQMSEFRLASELTERMSRPVDVILLKHSRLWEKILREGETWIV